VLLGPDGIDYGVTIAVEIDTDEATGVTIGDYYERDNDAGTYELEISTAVVDGIVTTALEGADDGTAEEGIATGLEGIAETTIYVDVGPDGIEFGVTNEAEKSTEVAIV